MKKKQPRRAKCVFMQKPTVIQDLWIILWDLNIISKQMVDMPLIGDQGEHYPNGFKEINF